MLGIGGKSGFCKRESEMGSQEKHDRILDALEELLQDRKLQTISVSDIARKAGIAKGSIYYYFPSKDAILQALIERNYRQPLMTAKTLAEQTNVSPFTRMAMIFQACRASTLSFTGEDALASHLNAQEEALLRQKYTSHLILELRPVLAAIIEQGIESGEIHFDRPAALAEIVLIVLTIKLDNTFVPSSGEEIEETLLGLISLLEKGTGAPAGSLNYLASPSALPSVGKAEDDGATEDH